jgi:hypothetical protein
MHLAQSSVTVDRTGGSTARRVTILGSWTVSTSHVFEHYCRPVSAGAANHVTLGELQTRASRLAQRSGEVTRQQGVW